MGRLDNIDSLEKNYRSKLDYIKKYKEAKNASSGSKFDSNANVENKNITTMAGEIPKDTFIGINRLLMHDKITEKYGIELANEYLKQLEHHEIYAHDETSIYPYCVAITMYPFLFEGARTVGGKSNAPKHLQSFCGSFVNLAFAIAAQFAGAVATPEFLMYMDYFIRKEYGEDYYLNPDKIVDLSIIPKSLDKVIVNYFEQVVYSLNEPAGARSFQSIFWNIAYFDEPYFYGLFKDFVFPDGTEPKWESLKWLQKRFINWFNEERLRADLTFPVETMNLLNINGEFADQEMYDFTAEMYSKGHSFFTYISDSVDSLSSCCRVRNEIQENEFSYTLGAGGVSTGSKGVMTININRLVQNAVKNRIDISDAVTEQVEKIHKYLLAYNDIIYDFYNGGLLPVYEAGYISLDRQYLTIGINGFVEGAEFLGIDISPNEDYYKYGEMILKPIYELNKRDKTKNIMFNCEFVPKMSGYKVV